MFQTSPHRLKSCFPCWKWCFPYDFQVFNYSIFESLSVDINSLNFFIFLVVTIISLAILAGWYCRYCIYFFDTYWTTWHLFKGGQYTILRHISRSLPAWSVGMVHFFQGCLFGKLKTGNMMALDQHCKVGVEATSKLHPATTSELQLENNV